MTDACIHRFFIPQGRGDRPRHRPNVGHAAQAVTKRVNGVAGSATARRQGPSRQCGLFSFSAGKKNVVAPERGADRR